MDQDAVKEKLLKLHDCAEDFSVVFSGKKLHRVNGHYKQGKKEIIIYNRNFESNENGEHLLFFTAMHELAHHIMFTELHKKSGKAHTARFYAILDDLADVAERKGIYKIKTNEDTESLVRHARGISCEIAALQKKLGQVLTELHKVCYNKGICYEDVIERKVQISRLTALKVRKAFQLNIPSDIGSDIQEAVLKERDKNTRELMIREGKNGRSVEQVKCDVKAGTLARRGRQRKRQAAKSATRWIIKAVNETLAETKGARLTK